MIAAAEEVGSTIIQSPTLQQREFSLGELTIEILNYQEIKSDFLIENANDYCWCVNVFDENHSVFLASDINNKFGVEDIVANQLGKVDAIKLGHHGITGSNTNSYLKKLHPRLAVLTGSLSTLLDASGDALFDMKTEIITADEAIKQGTNTIVLGFNERDLQKNVSRDL